MRKCLSSDLEPILHFATYIVPLTSVTPSLAMLTEPDHIVDPSSAMVLHSKHPGDPSNMQFDHADHISHLKERMQAESPSTENQSGLEIEIEDFKRSCDSLRELAMGIYFVQATAKSAIELF